MSYFGHVAKMSILVLIAQISLMGQLKAQEIDIQKEMEMVGDLRKMGKVQEAIPHALQVLSSLQQGDEATAAVWAGVTASLYLEDGKPTEAEPLYKRAIAGLRRTGQHSEEQATFLHELSFVLMERGALEEAEGYATEARALLLSEKTPRPALMARNLNNLGRISDLQSKYKNAQGYYLAAIEIFKNRLPSDPQYRETLFNLSESFKMQGDWRSSTQWCEKAAEMGLPAAQYYLGIRLVEGKWIAKNDERAVYWFSQAATAGLPAAQNNLGVMYSQGLGVAQSDSEAVKWYQKAAEQGYTSAQLNLAKKIMDGKGTPIDFVKAYYWLSRAAKSDPDDKEADEIRVSLSKKMTKDQMNAALLMLRGDK